MKVIKLSTVSIIISRCKNIISEHGFKRKYNANIAPGKYRFEITLNNYVLGNEFIDFVSTNTNITGALALYSSSVDPMGASNLILSKEDQTNIKYKAVFHLRAGNNNPEVNYYILGRDQDLYFYVKWFNLSKNTYYLVTTVYDSNNNIIDQGGYKFHPKSVSWNTWHNNIYNDRNAHKGKMRFELKLNNFIIGNEYIDFIEPNDLNTKVVNTNETISSNSIITNKMITND